MKVLDLHCDQGHIFEGWFGSEDDFQSQLARGLIACPLCSSTQVRKALSAPRLNLGAAELAPASAPRMPAKAALTPVPAVHSAPDTSEGRLRALQAAWLEVSRRIVQQTEDVGPQFADEARRIHRGEVQERGIRGQATPEQTQELLEEGIDILPLALPTAVNETLQ